jgi:hypothetical protein
MVPIQTHKEQGLDYRLESGAVQVEVVDADVTADDAATGFFFVLIVIGSAPPVIDNEYVKVVNLP